MKKSTLIPLIIIIVGVCLALAGFAAGGLKGFWIDRSGVHIANADRGELIKVDETYKSFKNINIQVDYIERVVLKEGDGYTVRAANYERYGGVTATLKGDTLEIDAKQNRKWNIDFSIDGIWDANDTFLEITYPKGAKLDDVVVNISSSKVSVNGIDCSRLSIDDNFGNVDVSSVDCGGLRIKADSGAIVLSDADVSGDCNIINDFGNVDLRNINAKALSADLDSGQMKANNLEADTIAVKNNFGTIHMDDATADRMTLRLDSGDLTANDITTGDLTIKSNFGKTTLTRLLFTGTGDIDADSGNVDISLLMNEDDLSYELKADAGSVRVGGGKFEGSVKNRSSGADASLLVKCNFGSINLDFLK